MVELDIEGIDGSRARLQCYVDEAATGAPGAVSGDGSEPSASSDPADAPLQQDPRPAVLVLPGGAYAITADSEAEPVALRMRELGYRAFVLRYSCAPSVYPVALLQVAEAVRLIREHAVAWGVNPHAIAVLGFSAGGHLAGLFAESWDSPLMAEHGFDPRDIRPDALALGYPVITAQGRLAPSLKNLLGPDRAADPRWLGRMSLELHVTDSVPPAFLWTTATDELIPAQHSLLFACALIEAGIGCELHVFPRGGHALSLATEQTASSPEDVVPCVQVWPDLFDTWMRGLFPQTLSWR